MRPLALLLAAALPAAAQTRVEVAAPSAGAGASASAAGAAVNSISLAPSAFALAPSLSAPSLNAGVPLAAPALNAAAPLAASAVTALDPKSLPAVAQHYDAAGWAKMTAKVPDEGTRAVLRTMNAGTNPQLTVTMADGSKFSGSFLGTAGDKIAFKSDGKLLGLDMNTRDIAEVTRMADVWFDGGTLRPEEVVVHSRPAAVADPYKDLAAYKGRFVEVDTRDLDDLKWSAQSMTGKVIKADGEIVELQGPKGKWTLQKEFHKIDAVSVRTEHYDSRGQVGSLSEVNAHIPPGTPVEAIVTGKSAPVAGYFRGVRSDKDGDYLLLETENSDGTRTVRAFREVGSVRTMGYKAGELMPGSERLFLAPDAPTAPKP